MAAVTVRGKVVAPVDDEVVWRWSWGPTRGALTGWSATITGSPGQMIIETKAALVLYTADGEWECRWEDIDEVGDSHIGFRGGERVDVQVVPGDVPSFWEACRRHLPPGTSVGVTSADSDVPRPPVLEPRPPQGRVFCSHCGGRLDTDANFCATCGQAVAGAASQPGQEKSAASVVPGDAAPTGAVTAVNSGADSTQVESIAAAHSQGQTPPELSPSTALSNAPGRRIGPLRALVILVLAGVSAYFLFSGLTKIAVVFKSEAYRAGVAAGDAYNSIASQSANLDTWMEPGDAVNLGDTLRKDPEKLCEAEWLGQAGRLANTPQNKSDFIDGCTTTIKAG